MLMESIPCLMGSELKIEKIYVFKPFPTNFNARFEYNLISPSSTYQYFLFKDTLVFFNDTEKKQKQFSLFV